MKKQTRRKFTPEFKPKVALDAIKDQMTLAQLAQKFEVNAVTISKWKSEFLANMSSVFSSMKETINETPEVPVEKLYAQIDQLTSRRGVDDVGLLCTHCGDIHLVVLCHLDLL
jgi:transposase-like protein